MRSDTVFKQAFNRSLDLLRTLPVGQPLPSENTLSRDLGVSRTTSRKVAQELARRGLIHECGSGWQIAGALDRAEPFPIEQTTSRVSHVERQFMEWILRLDTRPGTLITEIDLARRFGVANSAIREFLIRFSRFGLVEKKPNSGWLFRGFNEDLALELFEIRALFELRSAHAFAALPPGHPLWADLRRLKAEHEELLVEIDSRFHDFSSLDNRFHLLINAARPNRFIDDFYGLITLIFHYHYQWNKVTERDRNRVAIAEHLRYIDALFSRDPVAIEAACRDHLGSARRTLDQSLIRQPGEGVR